jgi:hypothetical protein
MREREREREIESELTEAYMGLGWTDRGEREQKKKKVSKLWVAYALLLKAGSHCSHATQNNPCAQPSLFVKKLVAYY